MSQYGPRRIAECTPVPAGVCIRPWAAANVLHLWLAIDGIHQPHVLLLQRHLHHHDTLPSQTASVGEHVHTPGMVKVCSHRAACSEFRLLCSPPKGQDQKQHDSGVNRSGLPCETHNRRRLLSCLPVLIPRLAHAGASMNSPLHGHTLEGVYGCRARHMVAKHSKLGPGCPGAASAQHCRHHMAENVSHTWRA